jgi:putative phosphoesterase
MRLAIISDVHSNIYALERVLEDIENRDVDQVFCAGDLVGYAPFPNEVVKNIREAEIMTVQGNYDDAISNSKIACGCDYKTEREKKIGLSSLNFTGEETNEENKAFLRDLPQKLKLHIDDYKILLVHGSPRKLNEYLYAESEELSEVVAELEEDILICGHTHLPYHRLVGEKHVINVGSVGKPKHGNPNAVYAIVEVKNENVRVEFIEVPYLVEKVTSKIRDTDLANELIEIFEGGG